MLQVNGHLLLCWHVCLLHHDRLSCSIAGRGRSSQGALGHEHVLGLHPRAVHGAAPHFRPVTNVQHKYCCACMLFSACQVSRSYLAPAHQVFVEAVATLQVLGLLRSHIKRQIYNVACRQQLCRSEMEGQPCSTAHVSAASVNNTRAASWKCDADTAAHRPSM